MLPFNIMLALVCGHAVPSRTRIVLAQRVYPFGAACIDLQGLNPFDGHDY